MTQQSAQTAGRLWQKACDMRRDESKGTLLNPNMSATHERKEGLKRRCLDDDEFGRRVLTGHVGERLGTGLHQHWVVNL
jgi:hypothetical protein